MHDISSRLRDMRRRFGLTQNDLGDRLGVKAITVSRWERGVQRVSIPGLLKFALERLEADLAEERRQRGPGRPPKRRRRVSARGDK